MHPYVDERFGKDTDSYEAEVLYDVQRRIIVWMGITKNAEKFTALFANPGSIGRNEDDTAGRFHCRRIRRDLGQFDQFLQRGRSHSTRPPTSSCHYTMYFL